MLSTVPFEIFRRIADHLTRHDQLVCLNVNKEWHHCFLPIVYRNVELKTTKGTVNFIETLRKFAPTNYPLGRHVYAISLRESSVTVDDVEEISALCPNIQCLSFAEQIVAFNGIRPYLTIPSLLLKNHDITKLELRNSWTVHDQSADAEEEYEIDEIDDIVDIDEDGDHDDHEEGIERDIDTHSNSNDSDLEDAFVFKFEDLYKKFVTQNITSYLPDGQHLRELTLYNILPIITPAVLDKIHTQCPYLTDLKIVTRDLTDGACSDLSARQIAASDEELVNRDERKPCSLKSLHINGEIEAMSCLRHVWFDYIANRYPRLKSLRITGTGSPTLNPVTLSSLRAKDLDCSPGHKLLAETCTELETVEFCDFLVDAKEIIEIINQCSNLRKCKILCNRVSNYMDAEEFIQIFNAAAHTNIESLQLCSYDLHLLLPDMLNIANNLIELFIHLSPSLGDEERFQLDVLAILLRCPNLKALGLNKFVVTKPWENGVYEVDFAHRKFPLERLELYSVPILPHLCDFLTKHCPDIRHLKIHNYHHTLLALPYHILDTLELCCRHHHTRWSARNHIFSLQNVMPLPPSDQEGYLSTLMFAEFAGLSMPPVWYRVYGDGSRRFLPSRDGVQHLMVQTEKYRRLTDEERAAIARKFKRDLENSDSDEEGQGAEGNEEKTEAEEEACQEDAGLDQVDHAFVEECFSIMSSGYFTGIHCGHIKYMTIENIPFIVNSKMID